MNVTDHGTLDPRERLKLISFKDKIVLDKAENKYREADPSQDFLGGQSRLYYHFDSQFLYEYVIGKNVREAKNWKFHVAMADLMRARCTQDGVGMGLIQGIGPAIHPLMSDHMGIIRDMVNWKSKPHDSNNFKRGSIFYIIKELIRGDRDTADHLWMKGKSHPSKGTFWKIEREVTRAMIDKDIKKIKEALELFLEPEMINNILDDVHLSGHFIQKQVIAYLKLARILGMEVSMEHEMVPQDLVEFAPLQNYEIKYEFMKRDDPVIKEIISKY